MARRPGVAECVAQERPQPWLNLRWHVVETHAEKRRVSCALRDNAGTPRALVHRLQAKGAMELTCFELGAMARRQGLFGAQNRDEL